MDIEELELEVKTYNRLKKSGISTTDELVEALYSREMKVSAPDAKKCEDALKEKGIIKYMRGDYVTEDDIEPEPLTWDELHDYIGKLVVYDCSTESHRWLGVIWLYDIQDNGEGTAICSDGSKSFSYIRRSTVNGGFKRDPEYLKRHEHLKNAGRMFALKSKEVKTVSEAQVLSADYTKAVSLHRRICANAQAAQESLYEMCKALKEMHDQKLYRELGYSSFEDYTEKEVGISRFMAYKYAAIADMKNVESIQQIGVTKLSLLAKLDEPQREEIQQNVDVESVTVKELKEKIAALTAANDTLREEAQEYKDEATEQRKLREELVDENGQMSDRISELLADNDEAKDTIQSLEQQIEALEDRPVEVAVQTNDEEIDKLTAQFKAELEKRDKDTERRLEEQKEKYQKQMREGIEKAKKEAQAPDIEELWRALYRNLDNAIEAMDVFFDDYEDHPKIKDYAQELKATVRWLNKLMNDVLAGE